ncbi:heme ABC transporter ATP-binding protein [Pseudosulfitobacter pseudonitzschiae]|uniref:heme ABC transporter ATP-binding protein n=1 Tax=Pseudosulfitobacter pseudonitzschiae TaxID=1402135 RepID=UPI001AF05FAA|nr:heme ABC transporter ATP-binding protein [Pseudosulfitobacter pseudonitzschiae]MBM1813671.1 heme ABC transporter ATP-binding protein [Pseudosulfitobacter pseudonitzschiae]MBM1830664.1 heme ABC transporter ATP-binding protein [Pseudosulfitobacter pseudonitzschiae]MBM1835531.1 heme ABC transporter ATP-binding protein [Pseudosulfitobacter pseudonitzschiae]MBM1840377.1 heme ABC transporter ATP-binding protein [Pseudosulfitobacter pseudonitzschiae]MBM1845635.1 heme ABC transporter ATP-binding pr
MLYANDISVSYGPKQVLHGLTLTAAPGTLTAIVGPNGSGKTTLMRALTGDVDFSGRITLGDTDIATAKPYDLAAQRAVLPQATPLAFPFQAVEVVRLGLRGGIETNDRLALTALSRVGLEGYANRFYQELSGGEQQRVQLARVLCQVWRPVVSGVPRWLFLDEPVSSLDIGHQLTVMQIARDFACAGGGVVAVMHDLNLSAMFAHQIVLMQSGRIIGHGPPAEVLTDAQVSRAYGCDIRTSTAPQDGGWFMLPQSAGNLEPMPVAQSA